MTSLRSGLLSYAPLLCTALGAPTVLAALALVTPLGDAPDYRVAAKVVFSLSLLLLAWYDWNTHLVPPQVSVPLMFTGLAVAVGRGVLWHDLSALPYLLGVLVLFALNLIAGGDAKLALGRRAAL